MKPYTVLMLYPGYIATNYGQETFLAHVRALSPADAAARGQQYAAGYNDLTSEAGDDFFVVLVIRGHHNDLRA